MSCSFPSKHTDLFGFLLTAEEVGVFTGETTAHSQLDTVRKQHASLFLSELWCDLPSSYCPVDKNSHKNIFFFLLHQREEGTFCQNACWIYLAGVPGP